MLKLGGLRLSPLILDLDGDGVETVGTNRAHPLFFDHDVNGAKESSGWVGSDDGLLVLDRNANGVIDNGAELFGDHTPLASGGHAADGYAALAQLDANGDGKVDASDASFANLRIWRDFNQDGVSQAGELSTLDSNHIASLAIAHTVSGANLANGNQVLATGSFTRTDGTTGRMDDINFAIDAFRRQFTDTIPLTAATQSLPDMQGSGLVRDLREAASLSPDLAATLASMQADTTRAQFQGQLDTLLTQWASTSTLQNSFAAAAAQNLALVFVPPGVTVEEAYVALHGNYLYSSTGGLQTTGLPTLTDERKAQILEQMAQIEHLIKVLEPFEGQDFLTLTPDGHPQGTTLAVNSSYIDATWDGTTIGVGSPMIFAFMEQGRLDLLNQAYTALQESAYQGLALQTWLRPGKAAQPESGHRVWPFPLRSKPKWTRPRRLAASGDRRRFHPLRKRS